MKEIYNENLSNKKLNTQKIKEQKANNEVSNEIFLINKKLNCFKKIIDDKKGVETKKGESRKYNIIIKDCEKEKFEKYFDPICPIVSSLIIAIIIKTNFVYSDNLKEQRYITIDKLKEIKKQNLKNNKIEKNIALRIYIELFLIKTIIIYIFSQWTSNNICILTHMPLILYSYINLIIYNLLEKNINICKKYNHQMKYNNKIMNLSQNNYKIIMNVDNLKNNNNIQFTKCSNYSFIKNVINIIIQINQRNIFINKIHDIIYNNNILSFCKSSRNIYYEFYLFQYKDNQIYIIKSNYEYYDSFIEKKEIFSFIYFIIILYLIIKEKDNKNKRNTIYIL